MAQISLLWNRNRYTDIENQLMIAKGEGEGVGQTGSLGLADANLHLEWKSNEVLLYSRGNSIQSLVIEHDGRQYEKNKVRVYTYMTGSLGCAAEIDTTL